MIYTCVATEIGSTRGRHYVVFWYKKDPNNLLEEPVKITCFGKHVIDNVFGGSFDRYLDIELVEYPLQQVMKYPNGKLVDKLLLTCVKVPMYEEKCDEKGIEHGHFKYVKSMWARGYSPDEVAARYLHILTPVKGQ